LKSVASVLQVSVRSGDHVVRWGGEEFLVILSDVGLDVAQELAERIRDAVQTQLLPEAQQCTLSLGVGIWQVGEPDEALLARIDAALYDAKRCGRNRVMVAVHGGGSQPLCVEGQTAPAAERLSGDVAPQSEHLPAVEILGL
jgi:diguanylate cyclase (GGDEF)-like protein